MQEKSFLLVGSPMCAHWSRIMNLNWPKMSASEREKVLNDARIHLRFVCRLYRLQHDSGRYFLHEHPSTATSWHEGCINEVKEYSGARCLTIDQCAYGLVSKGDNGEEGPARKRTTLMTNCPAMALTLNQKCPRNHEHVHLKGGSRCRKAQVYPYSLCSAIVEGVKVQQRWDKQGRYLLASIETEQAHEEHTRVEQAVPPRGRTRRYVRRSMGRCVGKGTGSEGSSQSKKVGS